VSTQKSHEEFVNLFYSLEESNEYEILEKYKTTHIPIKFKHKTCNHIFSMKPNNFTSGGQRCPKCNGRSKLTDKEVKERLSKEYVIIGEYVNSKTPIKVIHKKCNRETKITMLGFLKGIRCSYCANNKKLDLQEVSKRISLLSENEYTLDKKNEYKNVHTKLLFIHKECGSKFEMTFNNFRNGQRCPVCNYLSNLSKEMVKITDYLKLKTIKYESEVTIPKLKSNNGRDLRLDLYLPEYSIYIEYDGKQHFEFSKVGIFTESGYDEIITRDEIKNDFFKKNNLHLYRINYKEDTIKKLKKILEEGSTTIPKGSRIQVNSKSVTTIK